MPSFFMDTNKTNSYIFKKEVTFSFNKGILLSFLLAVLWFFFHSILLLVLNKNLSFLTIATEKSIFNPIYSLTVLFIGIAIQELIKAFLLKIMAQVSFRQMKAGFSFSSFMPYLESKYPVPLLTYQLMLLIPGMVIIQAVWLSYIANMYEYIIITAFWIFFSGFDLITLIKIRKYPKHLLVSTHPELPGVFLYDNPFINEEEI